MDAMARGLQPLSCHLPTFHTLTFHLKTHMAEELQPATVGKLWVKIECYTPTARQLKQLIAVLNLDAVGPWPVLGPNTTEGRLCFLAPNENTCVFPLLGSSSPLLTCSWHDGVDCEAPAPPIHRPITDELPLQLIPWDAQFAGPVRPLPAWGTKAHWWWVYPSSDQHQLP